MRSMMIQRQSLNERKKLNQIDRNSGYFTTVQPPPPPPPPPPLSSPMSSPHSAKRVHSWSQSYGASGSYHGNGSYPTSPSYGNLNGNNGSPRPTASFSNTNGSSSLPRKVQPRRRNGKGGGCSSFLFPLFFLIWTVGIVFGVYMYYESTRIPQSLQAQKQEADANAEIWTNKVAKLETSMGKLKKQNSELAEENKKTEAGPSEQQNKDFARAVEKIDALRRDLGAAIDAKRELEQKLKNIPVPSGNAQELQKSLQTISRRLLEERFGPGPYKVEFELNFPDDKVDLNWYFTVELATKEDMPHAVWTFLEQVRAGLYEDGGYSFYSNAQHILKGGPKANHLTSQERSDRVKAFNDSPYGRLEFPEYSANMPHEKYTLGMSGRPGGPDIYINMVDNSANHGPGGYAQDGTGDPCFGRVTVGTDVIDRIRKASPGGDPPHGEWINTEPGPIAVKSVKII